MSVPYPTFDFLAGKISGFARPQKADRVSLTFGYEVENFTTLNMTATEARAVANALYEAADAAEKVLPVAAPAPVAA